MLWPPVAAPAPGSVAEILAPEMRPARWAGLEDLGLERLRTCAPAPLVRLSRSAGSDTLTLTTDQVALDALQI